MACEQQCSLWRHQDHANEQQKGCMGMQEMSSRPAACLVSSSASKVTRDQVPVLFEQATVLAQQPGHYGAASCKVLEPEQECKSTTSSFGCEPFQG